MHLPRCASSLSHFLLFLSSVEILAPFLQSMQFVGNIHLQINKKKGKARVIMLGKETYFSIKINACVM